MSFTLSGIKVWYESVKTGADSTAAGRSPAGTELEKDVWGLALGLQYRFF
jgi:hypothetical protein